MRKVLLILIFLSFILPVYAGDAGDSSASSPVIEDEILKSKHFYKKIKPVIVKDKTPIKDELVEPEMYKNSVFRLGILKKAKRENVQISDELIDDDFVEKASSINLTKKQIHDDFFIEKKAKTRNVRKIKSKTKYDFTKKQIPVRIKIAKHLKSTKGMEEGSTIKFLATHDFEIGGQKFKKDTPVYGRIETISNSDKMGVPECIKIDNFYIKAEDSKELLLYGSISKAGANRSIWVYPLYQAGNICFYAAGFAFVPIHGGRAKLMPTETFTVYYETQ